MAEKPVNDNKFEIVTKQREQIFNQNAFFFFLLTGDNDITMLYTSFTGYEVHIFEVISYLPDQGSTIGGKMDQFGGKSKKMLNSAEFMEFVFSKSACNNLNHNA